MKPRHVILVVMTACLTAVVITLCATDHVGVVPGVLRDFGILALIVLALIALEA